MRPRILLVDDDVRFAAIVDRLLVRNGFDVLTADDGSEVLRTLSTTSVDAVVLDLHMLGMNGWEVIRAIRDPLNRSQLAGDVPPKIVVVTGRDERETKAFVTRLGADAYVTKPLRSNEIVQTLREVLIR